MPAPAQTTLAAAAHAYLEAGLCVLPADRLAKRPTLTWKEHQSRCPTTAEIDEWFTAQIEALCLVCGAVSGNLEIIDFDSGGEKYEYWRALVEKHAPGLIACLVIERTPSGGFHAFYRCATAVTGSVVLAQRRANVDNADDQIINGKRYKPRKDASGQWCYMVVLVETRGEGGVCLCAPSPKYELIQGEFTALTTITEEERGVLLACAAELNEMPVEVVDGPRQNMPTHPGELRPGDDFNARGEIRGLLTNHGWTLVREGENEHWARPGKTGGTSATLKGGVFYNFSSNGVPFEAHRGYSRFAVYALLEHDGDFAKAASALRAQDYGTHSNGHLSDGVLSTLPGTEQLSADDRADGLAPASLTVRQLLDSRPVLREPVIEGLLRRGETMNIIAPPKSHKSWLLLQMIISLVTGRPFLGCFQCTPREALLLDNELHGETLAHRIPYVVAKSGLTLDDVQDRICVDCVRGRCLNIQSLEGYFKHIKAGRYGFIGLDAFYRFIPPGVLENDNGMMAGLYNRIDAYAERLGCCFGLIHHASKGNQSGKSVTDVGAGAGAQSRAADTHLILRDHEEEGVMVLEAVTRSWPPVQPMCLRWEFPLWRVDERLDPNLLRGGRTARSKERPAAAEMPAWSVEDFVAEFITETPQSKDEIRTSTQGAKGLSWRIVNGLIDTAVAKGAIHLRTVGRSHKHLFASVPQPPEGLS